MVFFIPKNYENYIAYCINTLPNLFNLPLWKTMGKERRAQRLAVECYNFPYNYVPQPPFYPNVPDTALDIRDPTCPRSALSLTSSNRGKRRKRRKQCKFNRIEL